jgi:hypothetical protein
MRTIGYPRDFAAHAQQPAKPKFAEAGRRESGEYSDQERRTSQPAGEASSCPAADGLSIRASQGRALERFHDYGALSDIRDVGLFLVKSPVGVTSTDYTYRENR